MVRQTLGVCYYPEHWPEERWVLDAERMRKAGISHVRIGEFAWSRLQPSAGPYQFDWLRRAIEVLHKAGLKIVLGTPTATPPKWLVDSMPDMIAIDVQGYPRRFGSRRHYCFSHEGYHIECDKIVRALAQEFGHHPAIVAWQIDNEYGCHDTVESYSLAAQKGFRRWCAEKYGKIEVLNQAWGNVFWSMEYQNFDEIDLPNMTVTEANPAHRLDFQRYSSDQVVSFNRRQVEIIRPLSPGRDVLHNFMGSFTAFDHYKVSQDLDIATWDSYPLGFLDRDIKDKERQIRYLRVGDPDLQAFHHDLYRACGRGRWWVMEQQPGAVNWASHNPAPAPGAVRLWAHEAFAAGAEVVSFFRWRQAPFGQEQMHEALLLPNGEPGKAYEIAKNISEELSQIGAHAKAGRSPIALVFDYESEWAWKIQPQGREFSYFNLVFDYYRALRRAGCTIDIVPPHAEAIENRKLILLPGLFAPSPDFVVALERSQAVIVMGPRSGSKTPDFQIPADLPPGELKRLIDLRIEGVESLPTDIHVSMDRMNSSAYFHLWREFVSVDRNAEILWHTEDRHSALIGHKNHFYIAGIANDLLLDIFMDRFLKQAGLPYLALPMDLRLRDHGPHRFFFNHGPDPINAASLIGDAEILIGSAILSPYGITIVVRNG